MTRTEAIAPSEIKMHWSKVCTGVYQSTFLRMPADARGFRRSVQWTAERRIVEGDWVARLASANCPDDVIRVLIGGHAPYKSLKDLKRAVASHTLDLSLTQS